MPNGVHQNTEWTKRRMYRPKLITDYFGPGIRGGRPEQSIGGCSPPTTRACRITKIPFSPAVALGNQTDSASVGEKIVDDPRICSTSCINDACSGCTHGLKITNNNKKRGGDGQPLCTGRTFVDSTEGTMLTLTQKKLGVSCFTGSRTRKLSKGIINRVRQSHFNAFCTSLSNKNGDKIPSIAHAIINYNNDWNYYY